MSSEAGSTSSIALNPFDPIWIDDQADATPTTPTTSAAELQRTLDWRDAFWASSGVPAGVLLTVGGIAATVGQPAWIVWIASILMGFVQSFTYAEIAGLFPHKSGGASVYGASAWIGYSKFIAPVSVWCNWLAWSPVLALGTGLSAGYILFGLFPADAVIHRWQITLFDLGWIHPGLTLRINAVFVVAACLLLLTFFLQHHGAAKAAHKQKILGIACLLPLLIVGLVPVIFGDMPSDHFFPLLPMLRDTAGHIGFGTWNAAGITLLMGAMFAANWSTFGFETAVCYTREFKNPGKDTFKAIFSSGILCMLLFILVPLSFQGSLGLSALLDPRIYDGTGVALAMATMVGGGVIITHLIIVMLLLSLLLIVMTSMMGSSRTLYQASLDGWLPRYLAHVNRHGSPTSAMWTDLAFNLVLLMLSDYFMILMISNVCYLLFNFLNLQAGWIHRIDRGNWPRPFRCPTWLLGLGGAFGFVNMIFIGAGADVWGENTLRNGLIAAALILPIFVYRHYIQDKGVFPPHIQNDDTFQDMPTQLRAGRLPNMTLLACVVTIGVSYYFAHFSY